MKKLCAFSDVISVGEKDLGRTNVLKHKVNLGNAPPIHQQARRPPYHQRETVKKMLDDMPTTERDRIKLPVVIGHLPLC